MSNPCSHRTRPRTPRISPWTRTPRWLALEPPPFSWGPQPPSNNGQCQRHQGGTDVRTLVHEAPHRSASRSRPNSGILRASAAPGGCMRGPERVTGSWRSRCSVPAGYDRSDPAGTRGHRRSCTVPARRTSTRPSSETAPFARCMDGTPCPPRMYRRTPGTWSNPRTRRGRDSRRS